MNAAPREYGQRLAAKRRPLTNAQHVAIVNRHFDHDLRHPYRSARNRR
jgi:hypothetical protein